MNLNLRTLEALAGAIFVVLVGSVALLGIRAAGGAYADDYTISASTARTGFGLDESSDVKIRGVTVGSVKTIDLAPDGTVNLELAIRKEVKVPTSATATIEPLSVFGPKFVELVPGSGEITGPFLSPGDSLGAVVAPTEIAETLNSLSRLLERVDAENIGIVIGELARGFDGLGDELGVAIDGATEISARLAAKKPQIDALVRNASLVAAELAKRSDAIGTLASDGQDLLRFVATEGDALGEVLTQVSELSIRLDDIVTIAADDLDATLIGLSGAARVLREQLLFIPDLLLGLDELSGFLSTGLFAWDRGNGEWGGLAHGTFDFGTCRLVPVTACGPIASYERPS